MIDLKPFCNKESHRYCLDKPRERVVVSAGRATVAARYHGGKPKIMKAGAAREAVRKSV